MLRLFRNRLFIGGACLLLAGALTFGLLPRLYAAKAETTQVVQLLETVERGTAITEDMVKATETGAHGLSEQVVRDKAELAGLVARETIYAGEYLWRQRLTRVEDFPQDYTGGDYGVAEGMVLLTIRLPSESAGLAGVLRSGDIVDVYGYIDRGEGTSASTALNAVRVYKVLNSKLMPLDTLDAELAANPDKKISDYDFAPAYIVFVVNEQEAEVLIGLEQNKALHLVLREAGEKK